MGQILPTFHYSWHCRKRWRATSAPTSTSQRRRPPRDSGPTIKESFLGINGLFPGIYGFSREFVATFWESMAFLPGVIGLFSRRWQTQWLVKEKKEQRYVQGETEVLYWRVEDFSKIILIFGNFFRSIENLYQICTLHTLNSKTNASPCKRRTRDEQCVWWCRHQYNGFRRPFRISTIY